MLKVGDIVICHGWDKTENKKGFIEEIVSNSDDWRGGLFSIYGLEPTMFVSGNLSYYYGDHVGNKLEATGEKMNEAKLLEYKVKLSMNNENGHIEDIDKVIKNLGRSSGRNEN